MNSSQLWFKIEVEQAVVLLIVIYQIDLLLKTIFTLGNRTLLAPIIRREANEDTVVAGIQITKVQLFQNVIRRYINYYILLRLIYSL